MNRRTETLRRHGVERVCTPHLGCRWMVTRPAVTTRRFQPQAGEHSISRPRGR